ncbi:hypothetical protein D3C86_1499000 [compost metagenome]
MVELACQHIIGDLVERGGIFTRAIIQHLYHALWVQARLDTNHYRFSGGRQCGGRQEVIDELHVLPQTRSAANDHDSLT